MAEEMYAELGINGVTTRSLAERAGVNIAAVNYHFGNKDNLMLEVFRNVCRITVKRRLDALDAIEARIAAEGGRPSIREIVEAFVDAYINEDAPRTGVLLAHFVLKHRVEPNSWTRAIVSEELDGMALRYIEALRAAAPHLTPQQAHWRYHMMVSSIVMTLSDETTGGRIARLSGGQCQPLDRKEFREEMVAFVVNAFGGPT
jgi:AcrR family transcriptional regulator